MGGGDAAVYVAFGRSQGWMSRLGGPYRLLDVHGAGSQRSDPKAGDPSRFPRGRGPQGDVIVIYNMVRPVRGGNVSIRESGPEPERPASAPRVRGPAGVGPGPPKAGKGPGFVTRLDRDGDGKVSRKEFDGPAAAFDRLDVDQDGYLTDSESPVRQGMGLPKRKPFLNPYSPRD
ncbi:MAG: hypothetical protein JJ992_00100 [Planctomycetes bacterium]|nr:hypothetical protein [Planctomycetota bacterium]